MDKAFRPTTDRPEEQFCVYQLRDQDGVVRYVGCGGRKRPRNSALRHRMAAEIVASGLVKDAALAMEARLINLIGLEVLTANEACPKMRATAVSRYEVTPTSVVEAELPRGAGRAKIQPRYRPERRPARPALLQTFQLSVMSAVRALQADGAYGLAVTRWLAERATGNVWAGAVETTLRRLTASGMLSVAYREMTARGRRQARKLYEITDAGREAMARSDAYDAAIRGHG